MWRTLLIANGEKVSVKNNWLIVETDEEYRVPIDDIYSVVIDNRQAFLTVGAITALTDAGVHIIYCSEKHVPVSVTLPLNTHFKPLGVIKKQIEMGKEFKDALWQHIIKAKIQNQIEVLKISGAQKHIIEHLIKFRDEVVQGDRTNREGLAAKMFFRALYGSDFIRMADDAINAALNYGYAIIRSAFAKTLAAYGYNCVLGIFHISESNPFNLADDLMEPVRPIVDMWVDINHEELFDELTPSNKKGLIDLMNRAVLTDNRKMKLRYAIDKYVSSLTTCIEKNNASLLKIPRIIRFDCIEDESDG